MYFKIYLVIILKIIKFHMEKNITNSNNNIDNNNKNNNNKDNEKSLIEDLSILLM